MIVFEVIIDSPNKVHVNIGKIKYDVPLDKHLTVHALPVA